MRRQCGFALKKLSSKLSTLKKKKPKIVIVGIYGCS